MIKIKPREVVRFSEFVCVLQGVPCKHSRLESAAAVATMDFVADPRVVVEANEEPHAESIGVGPCTFCQKTHEDLLFLV